MRIMELLTAIFCTALAVVLHNTILLFFALTIIPANMNSYYKFLYQATGDFDRYGRILNLSTILTFVVNIIIVFLLHLDNYIQILALYVTVQLIIWIVLEIRFKQSYQLEKAHSLFSFSIMKENISLGFFLTVGNLASLLLSSMDRWFVKVLLTSTSFAYYSFAVSVEGFLNIAITPVTTTLYNYFCKEKDIEKHKSAFRYIIVFACFLPCAAFPFKLVLQFYLPAYITANGIIFILFASKIFSIIVNSLFVNLYKVNRKQTVYFIKLVIVLFVGFLLNIIFYKTMGNNEGFAFATLISSCVWFAISISDFKYLKFRISEAGYILISIVTLLVLGMYANALIGLLIYFAIEIIFGVVLMKETFKSIWDIAFSKIRNIGRKAL